MFALFCFFLGGCFVFGDVCLGAFSLGCLMLCLLFWNALFLGGVCLGAFFGWLFFRVFNALFALLECFVFGGCLFGCLVEHLLGDFAGAPVGLRFVSFWCRRCSCGICNACCWLFCSDPKGRFGMKIMKVFRNMKPTCFYADIYLLTFVDLHLWGHWCQWYPIPMVHLDRCWKWGGPFFGEPMDT